MNEEINKCDFCGEIKYQEFKKQGYSHQQARELALKVCSEEFKKKV